MVKRITYHMSQSAPTEITADPADFIEDESSESGDEDEAEIEDEDEMEVIQIGSDAEETDEEESSEDEEEPTVKKPGPGDQNDGRQIRTLSPRKSALIQMNRSMTLIS